jgi:4-diphosphocytidyl-2-C-methyl-D-erythritol kinase
MSIYLSFFRYLLQVQLEFGSNVSYTRAMPERNQLQMLLHGELTPDRTTVRIAAPAKINLFLKVIGRRTDGFHNIYSCFQAVDLFDILELRLLDQEEIRLSIRNGAKLTSGPDNMVWKAARLMKDSFGIRSGFDISLHKQIPIGSGLGGGSSDAAACMKGIARLLQPELPVRRLQEESQKIGSDLPFFFSPGQALVTGRGEKVQPLSLPTDYAIVLAIFPFQIRAAEAYRRVKIDLTGGEYRRNFDDCQSVEQLIDIIHGVPNDLETALLRSYSDLSQVREELVEAGAHLVRMSGSGPTIFAIFDHRTMERVGRLEVALPGATTQLVHPVIIPV